LTFFQFAAKKKREERALSLSLSLSANERDREREKYREKRCVVIFPISSAIALFVVVFIFSEEENLLRLHRLVW